MINELFFMLIVATAGILGAIVGVGIVQMGIELFDAARGNISEDRITRGNTYFVACIVVAIVMATAASLATYDRLSVGKDIEQAEVAENRMGDNDNYKKVKENDR